MLGQLREQRGAGALAQGEWGQGHGGPLRPCRPLSEPRGPGGSHGEGPQQPPCPETSSGCWTDCGAVWLQGEQLGVLLPQEALRASDAAKQDGMLGGVPGLDRAGFLKGRLFWADALLPRAPPARLHARAPRSPGFPADFRGTHVGFPRSPPPGHAPEKLPSGLKNHL